MLHQTSPSFKKLFLLHFTRELIKNSSSSPIYELETVVKNEEKDIKEKIKTTIHKKELPEIKIPIIRIPKKRKLPRVLRIPRIKLPARLRYLKPTPTKTEIELGKLNPLIKDPQVKRIEVNGPDEQVVVSGSMGTKATSITLTGDEIDQIINTISETAKIPTHEGIFNAVVGRFEFSAILSTVVGSKFIIQKLTPHRNLR
jgi:hypothetical protein